MGSTSSRLASFIHPILIASTCSLVACGGGGGGDNSPPPDTTPPTATIVFPPPVSATIGNTITVRGTASDDRSDITGVRVNNVDAQSDDGFATWTATVDLNLLADNELVVSVSDSAGNDNASAATAMIRQQADQETSFPDMAGDAFNRNPAQMALDKDGQRLFVCGYRAVYEVSLTTAMRKVLVNNSTQAVIDLDDTILTCLLDRQGGRNRLVMTHVDNVLTYDIATEVLTVISSNALPNSGETVEAFGVGTLTNNGETLVVADLYNSASKKMIEVNLTTGVRSAAMNLLDDTQGPIVSGDAYFIREIPNEPNAYFLAEYIFANGNIYKIDLNTNTRELISSNTIPNADEPLFDRVVGFDVNALTNQLYFNNDSDSNIIGVSTNDASLGEREVIWGVDFPGGQNSTHSIGRGQGIEIDEDAQIAYISDISAQNSILLVDLKTMSDVLLTIE